METHSIFNKVYRNKSSVTIKIYLFRRIGVIKTYFGQLNQIQAMQLIMNEIFGRKLYLEYWKEQEISSSGYWKLNGKAINRPLWGYRLGKKDSKIKET